MKRRTTAVAAALSAGVLLASCNANPDAGSSSSASAESTARGGSLSVLNDATETSFEPAESQSLAITSLGLVHRRLTTWDIQPGQKPKLVPDLATDTGTASDDGRTWTFKLKEGVKFSSGKPITSADIKYGLERSFAPQLAGGLGYHKTLLKDGDGYTGPYQGKHLSSISAPDERTIVFTLNAPFGDWPWIASMPAFSPVPKSADTKAETYGEKPVASGPYQVDSYKQGSAMNLKRNPEWSRKTDPVRLGGPDRITIKLGQEPTVAAQQLIADSGAAKSAFASSFVPPAQLKQITSNADAKSRLALSNPGALKYLAFNNRRGKLTDARVRKALTYAVDKRAFQLAVGGEQGGTLATTLITPGISGRQQHDLFPAPPSGDVNKAKSLLAQAGATSLKLTLVTANDGASVSQAEAIQQGLKRAGVQVTIKPLASETYSDAITGDKGDYDLTVSSWQPDYPSAGANIKPLFASSEIGGGGYNLSRYSNPSVDRLIQQATGEVNPDRAAAVWAKADRRISQDAPVVPLVYTRNAFLRGSEVRNFDVSGFPNYPNYLRISVAK